MNFYANDIGTSLISCISKFCERKNLVSCKRPKSLLASKMSSTYRTKEKKLTPTDFKVYALVYNNFNKFVFGDHIMKLYIPLVGCFF